MKITTLILISSLIIAGGTFMQNALFSQSTLNNTDIIKLPPPQQDSETALEAALSQRRSIRKYQDQPLSLQQLSQILWSAQGITSARGLRAAPSAGATYPLEVYVVVSNVQDLDPGIYHFRPEKQALQRHISGNHIQALAAAALNQACVRQAPMVIAIAAVYTRTTSVYNDRGRQYVHMEVGHVGENIYLQAESLGLGTVAVGAFHDRRVGKVLQLPQEQAPLYLMPIGRPE